MMFARIIEDHSTGKRWLEIPLPGAVDDEDDRALVAFARRFFDAIERQCNRADERSESWSGCTVRTAGKGSHGR
jgi:hypothetical protein